MRVTGFISRKLSFRGRLAEAAVALSFLVVAVAVSVSAGFRREIRQGVREAVGDLRIVEYSNLADVDSSAVVLPKALREQIRAVPGVAQLRDVVARGGIVKEGETVHGVLVKGIEGGVVSPADTSAPALCVSIPSRLSEILGVGQGDALVTYFVGGEKVKVRKFHIAAVRPDLLEMDSELIVLADIADMRRLNLWNEEQSSGVEILADALTEEELTELRDTVQDVLDGYESEDSYPVVTTAVESYPQLFAWLDLLDINVLILLVLMGVVAGFNMISGLLIMLLRGIPTIGTLKALGMRNGPLARTYLLSATRIMLRGLLIGNALALVLCLIQSETHLLTLNPAHYFVSYVPIAFDGVYLLLANLGALALAEAMILLPLLMIARVDPASTVRGKL